MLFAVTLPVNHIQLIQMFNLLDIWNPEILIILLGVYFKRLPNIVKISTPPTIDLIHCPQSALLDITFGWFTVGLSNKSIFHLSAHFSLTLDYQKLLSFWSYLFNLKLEVKKFLLFVKIYFVWFEITKVTLLFRETLSVSIGVKKEPLNRWIYMESPKKIYLWWNDWVK